MKLNKTGKLYQLFSSKRMQLILLIGAIVTGFSLFIYFYFPSKFEENALNVMLNKSQIMTEYTAINLSPFLVFNDEKGLYDYMHSVLISKDIVKIEVLDEFSNILYNYDINKKIQLSTNLAEGIHGIGNGEFICCVKKTNYEGSINGKLMIVFSLKEVKDDVNKSKESIFYISIMLIIFGLIISVLISRLFTSPINNLKKIFNKIADGDLNIRAKSAGVDEISSLAISFNKMVDKLDKAYQDLEEINKNLEFRVEERTKSLKKEIENKQVIEINLLRINQIFSSIIDSSPLPIVTFNSDAKINSISPAFKKLFGYSEQEILSNYLPLINLEEKQHFTENIEYIFEKRIPINFQTFMYSKSMDIRNIQLNVSPIFDEHEAVSVCIGIIEDITERIRKERALRESEEKYRKLIENSLVGIGIFKEDRCIFANQSLINLWGFDSFDEFSYISLAQFVLPNSESIFRNIISTHADLNKTIVEIEIIRKDAQTKVLEVSRTIININNELYPLVTFLDITDRKNAENEIRKLNFELENRVLERTAMLDDALNELRVEIEERRKAEDQLRLSDKILQRVGTLVLVADSNAKIIYASQYVKNIIGYEPEDLLGSGWWNITTTNEIDRLNEKNYIIECAKGNMKLIEGTYERKILSKDGHLKWIQWQDALGEGDTIIGVGHDVTDKVVSAERLKLASNELAKALEKEKELSELKTRFISMISHEYRTPLTVILSSTNIVSKLIDKHDYDKAKTFLVKIENSVQSMVRLLEDVLIIGRSESGKLTAHYEEVDLIKLTQDIIDDFRSAHDFENPIKFMKYGELTNIKTDAKLIRQILTNLISNALKYSPNKTPVNIEIKENPWEVFISVVDLGIGISEEDQKYLFDTFHRGKNVGTISGTGLGMPIVKRCVDSLKGHLSLSSEVGKGTAINVVLPKND